MIKILLAEDEKSLSKVTTHLLEKNGYHVTPVYNGQEAIEAWHVNSFDLLILDVMMPKLTGIEVLQEIRKHDDKVKILILTAKSEIEDKLIGLENDADDYMTKPFDYRELIARIKILTKNIEKNTTYQFGNVILNPSAKNLQNTNNKNMSCALTESEVNILKSLYTHREISQSMLTDIMDDDEEKANLYVKFLNNKLKSLSSTFQIYSDNQSVRLQEAYV